LGTSLGNALSSPNNVHDDESSVRSSTHYSRRSIEQGNLLNKISNLTVSLSFITLPSFLHFTISVGAELNRSPLCHAIQELSPATAEKGDELTKTPAEGHGNQQLHFHKGILVSSSLWSECTSPIKVSRPPRLIAIHHCGQRRWGVDLGPDRPQSASHHEFRSHRRPSTTRAVNIGT